MTATLERRGLTSWERFCKQEAIFSASLFLERVKSFKDGNAEASRIPDSLFVQQFSKAFLEEILSLSENNRRVTDAKSAAKSGGKSWWSIFKRSKSKSELKKEKIGGTGGGGAAIALAASKQSPSSCTYLLNEGIVNQLNMKNASHALSWSQCRLALMLEQGSYQLKVFCPPKSAVPKMSLFCFLIESVRSTTALEIPDMSSTFVVKSHSYGEYVFDAGSREEKDKWVSCIKRRLGPSEDTTLNNGHLQRNNNHHNSVPPENTHHQSSPRGSLASSNTPSPRSEREKSDLFVLWSDLRNIRARSMFVEAPVAAGLPDHSPPVVRSKRPGHRPQSTCIEPRRKTSQPEPFVQQELPLLESCSRSSSSSALHPVSIAAINRSAAQGSSGGHRNGSTSMSMDHVSADVRQKRERRSHSTSSLGRVEASSSVVGGGGEGFQLEKLPVAVAEDESKDDGVFGSVGSNSTAQGGIPANDSERTLRASPDSPDNEQQSTEQSSELTGASRIFIETAGSECSSYWAKTQRDLINLRTLSQYKWFHGMISRTDASELVLVNGENGSGQYLLRQSESREGDFVLTFNYHNRAKHLRLALDDNGCNIQHLWFDDVPSMLEYFRTSSIPLESFWLNEDVKLSTYIDRSLSDSLRTPTVVNVDSIQRTPPRRSHSLHLSTVQATLSSQEPSPTLEQAIGRDHSTGSLPSSVRNSTTWRQLLQSSSAGSIGRIHNTSRQHSLATGSSILLQQHRPVENNYV